MGHLYYISIDFINMEIYRIRPVYVVEYAGFINKHVHEQLHG